MGRGLAPLEHSRLLEVGKLRQGQRGGSFRVSQGWQCAMPESRPPHPPPIGANRAGRWGGRKGRFQATR